VARPVSDRNASRVLPGLGLTLGVAMLWLGLIVLVPLAGLLVRGLTLSPAALVGALASPRTLAAFRLSLGAALAAAIINAVFGTLVAWVLVRYRFPLRSLVDGLVDLPFALPTAVAGLALTALYSEHGWLGGPLARTGVKVAYTWLGVLVALTFIGLPFVVRTVEPVLADLDREYEDAAASLGAPPFLVFGRVLFPEIRPAVLTGFTLALARAVGEYGSVIFIAGNLPGKTEIVPLLIVIRLESFDYTGATALGLAMLLISFALLFTVNLLQRWQRRGPQRLPQGAGQ
jgi:sulfate/thiosulfate transport system permease protein